MTSLDLVKSIQSLGAPSPALQQWIDATEAALAAGWTGNAVGDANGATDEQSMAGIEALQTGTFTFDEETHRAIIDFLAELNPYLPALAVNSGLLTDPGFLGPWPQDEAGYYHPPGYDPDLPLADQTVGEYGGLNNLLLWDDFLGFLDPSGGLSDDLDALWAEIMSWFDFSAM